MPISLLTSKRLVLHPRVTAPNRLRVWLGAVGQTDVPKLRWFLDGAEATPVPIRPLGRAYEHPGSRLRGVLTGVYEFVGVTAGDPHRVLVQAERNGIAEPSDELSMRTLPPELPDTAEQFNVLLVSCFAQRTDVAGLAGHLVANLPADSMPHLILAVGDQVYLDDPPLQSETDQALLTELFEQKYLENWMIPVGRTNGYAQILHTAPTAFVPDDHEYWNNYPRWTLAAPATFSQQGRDAWAAAARALFEAFQRDEPGIDCQTIDIEPLSFFLMDNRTSRSYDYERTLSDIGRSQFTAWAERIQGSSTIPVLVTGPSLFQQRSIGLEAKLIDGNLSNYSDYKFIVDRILQLARAGSPVLLLTGDVHYGRVVSAHDLQIPPAVMHEVISSPSSLIAIPGADQWKKLKSGFGGIFGHRRVAARWDDAEPMNGPGTLPNISTALTFATLFPTNDLQRGNHVAVLSFRRTQFGVDLTITYHFIPSAETSGNQPRVQLDPIHLNRRPQL